MSLRFAIPVLAALSLGGLPALARDFTLTLPGHPEVTAAQTEALASRALPIGGFDNGKMATKIVKAPLSETAFRIAGAGLGTAQMIESLRAQIVQAGFKLTYECDTHICGGFDFRYGMQLMPEPDMHVDLGDFRYLLAERGADTISLMVSRSDTFGFVQVTQMGDFAAAAPKVTESSKSPVLPDDPAEPTMSATLASGQAAVLQDLVFASGKANLTAGEYPSLKTLADFMARNPDMALTINGHTDSSGNASANLALSQARAESLRDWLVAQYGIDPARITAQGLGDTAPRASNDTPAGRAQNRRVEVVARVTR